ncbi:hypothetical protein BH11PSE11_BH11PSE11_18100 [soil metagenome]
MRRQFSPLLQLLILFTLLITGTAAHAQIAQVITFNAQATQTFASGGTFGLNPVASASSGLAVTYTSTTNPVCTISGSVVTIVSAGTCTIAANQAGDATYSAAPQVTQNITINVAAQTINFGPQAGKTFGVSASPFALSPLASASSGLAVTYTSTTPAVCTNVGSSVTIVGPGNCTIAVDQAGNGNFSAAPQVSQNILIAPTPQTITFGAQTGQTYGAAPFAVSPLATASSGLAVSYSSTSPAVCSVAGSTVTIITAGTCTIAANQSGDATRAAAAQVTQNITIAKANQTITFGAQGGQTFAAGGSFVLSPAATASSGLPVSYSSTTPSVCTVSAPTAPTVNFVSGGVCTIAANQAAGTNYNAAPQVTQGITIGKAAQTINFPAQANKIMGAVPAVLNPLATATSGLPVTYTSTTTSVCTVVGNNVTIVSVGTCTIAAAQAGNTNYFAALTVTQDIIINSGVQTITFNAQAGRTFGATAAALNPLASASSALPVTYSSLTLSVCSIAGNIVTVVGAGTCTIAANQAGNANYNAATQVTQNITVNKGNQTIAFAPQPGKLFGVAPFPLSPLATATSGLAVTYASTTPTICTNVGSSITILSAGTCTISANQAGDANYNAAVQATQNIIVSKGTQTISFASQTGQNLGVAPFDLNPVATASSGLAVTYASTSPIICSISGITVTALAVGTCTISASQAGNANYAAAAVATQNITIGKPTAPGMPTLTSVIAGYGSASVSYNAPALNGGSVITGYTATCSATDQASRTATGSGTTSMITVQGLTLGVTYSCSVTATNAIGTGAPSAALPVTPAPIYLIPVDSSPLTGLWWNESESGWGVSVNQHGSTIFAAWFTYDQAGAPVWYVMSSCPILGNACTGDLYAVSGGTSLTSPWNASRKSVTKVGTGILTFANANTGVFNFSINGVPGSKFIVRQMFGSGTTAPTPDYSDLWWNPNESGWGVTLSQQYGVMFAAIFSFDAIGNPVWYVVSNCVVSEVGCSGDLYRVVGGSRPTIEWNGTNLAVDKVGFIDFLFSDSSNGRMNFFIDGLSNTKLIMRQSF